VFRTTFAFYSVFQICVFNSPGLCIQLTRFVYTPPISFPQLSCTEGHTKSPRGPFAAKAAASAALAAVVAVALAALAAAVLSGCCC
jgi:hypothetical protein